MAAIAATCRCTAILLLVGPSYSFSGPARRRSPPPPGAAARSPQRSYRSGRPRLWAPQSWPAAPQQFIELGPQLTKQDGHARRRLKLHPTINGDRLLRVAHLTGEMVWAPS